MVNAMRSFEQPRSTALRNYPSLDIKPKTKYFKMCFNNINPSTILPPESLIHGISLLRTIDFHMTDKLVRECHY